VSSGVPAFSSQSGKSVLNQSWPSVQTRRYPPVSPWIQVEVSIHFPISSRRLRYQGRYSEDVAPDLLLLGQLRVRLEGGEQLVRFHRTPLVEDPVVPGLVVDPDGGDVHEPAVPETGVGFIGGGELLLVAVGVGEGGGDLAPSTLHAVAEADGVDAFTAVEGVERRPRVHGHGVGVVQEERAAGRIAIAELGHVLLEGEDLGNVPLPVHDAPGAEGVPDALVDPVAERDLDVGGKGLEPADARAVHDVAGAVEGPAPLECADQLGRQVVGRDLLLENPVDTLEVPLVDVVKGDLQRLRPELGHEQEILDELAGEADAAGPDECDAKGHGCSVTLKRNASRWPE